MNKLIYNTINNDGIMQALGPHKILVSDNLQSTTLQQTYKKYPPIQTKNIVIREEITCLKKKIG